MTTTALAPEADASTAVEAPEAAPIIKQSAVPSKKSAADVQAAKLAALAESGRFRSSSRAATNGDWYSGWCGSGPCRDGKIDPNTQAPRHRCLGLGENGVKITPRYLFCACTCHRTNDLAVPVPEDLSLGTDAAAQADDARADEATDE